MGLHDINQFTPPPLLSWSHRASETGLVENTLSLVVRAACVVKIGLGLVAKILFLRILGHRVLVVVHSCVVKGQI